MSPPLGLWLSNLIVFLLVAKAWTSAEVEKKDDLQRYSHLTGHTTRILIPHDAELDETFWKSILGEDYERAVHFVVDEKGDVRPDNKTSQNRNGTATNAESTATKKLEKPSVDGMETNFNRNRSREEHLMQNNTNVKGANITMEKHSIIESRRNGSENNIKHQLFNKSEPLINEPEKKNEIKTLSQPNESQKTHLPTVIDHNEIHKELKEPQEYQKSHFSSQPHKLMSSQAHPTHSQKKFSIPSERSRSNRINKYKRGSNSDATDRDNNSSRPTSVIVNLLEAMEKAVATQESHNESPTVLKFHQYLNDPAYQYPLDARMNTNMNKLPDGNTFSRSDITKWSNFQSTPERAKNSIKELFEVGL